MLSDLLRIKIERTQKNIANLFFKQGGWWTIRSVLMMKALRIKKVVDSKTFPRSEKEQLSKVQFNHQTIHSQNTRTRLIQKTKTILMKKKSRFRNNLKPWSRNIKEFCFLIQMIGRLWITLTKFNFQVLILFERMWKLVINLWKESYLRS